MPNYNLESIKRLTALKQKKRSTKTVKALVERFENKDNKITIKLTIDLSFGKEVKQLKIVAFETDTISWLKEVIANHPLVLGLRQLSNTECNDLMDMMIFTPQNNANTEYNKNDMPLSDLDEEHRHLALKGIGVGGDGLLILEQILGK